MHKFCNSIDRFKRARDGKDNIVMSLIRRKDDYCAYQGLAGVKPEDWALEEFQNALIASARSFPTARGMKISFRSRIPRQVMAHFDHILEELETWGLVHPEYVFFNRGAFSYLAIGFFSQEEMELIPEYATTAAD